MYGLPKDTDVSFLLGRRLDQIRLGKYVVELCFDNEVSILMQAAFTLDGSRFEDGASGCCAIAKLVGEEITDVRVPGNGDLFVRFSPGPELVIHDSEDGYESYIINFKSSQIIV